MSYFAGRAAPMGAVAPPVVTASFFNFAPPMVERALPDAWSFAPPEAVLATRLASVDAVLRRMLGDRIDSAGLAEAADLASEAAAGCSVEGRPLAAAWSSVEPPPRPHQQLWAACTVLREHRGDGHVAALVDAGLDGCEVHVMFAAAGRVTRESQQPARGWTDDDWDAARSRLTGRGWLDGDALTEAGRAAHRRIEDATDRLALEPWTSLGDARAARFEELLGPLSAAVVAAGDIRYPNPMGLPPA